jgi:uncharacterized phage-associated protein
MNERPLDPRSLANYILAERKRFGYETSNLELQKLAVFAYAKYLKTYGEKLCEGYFEAWEHGPVHPLLYREFKKYGAAPITEPASETNLITGASRVVPVPNDNKRCAHISETILQLRTLTASQLRAKSHAKGSSWHKIWESAKINLASHTIIPDNVVREEFNRHILSIVDINVEYEEDSPLEDFPPKFDRSR